jgi:hypothetical protein
MNFKAFALASLAGASLAAHATGGFYCEAETHSGKKVSVSACVPHGIDGLCSGISIDVAGNKTEITRERVPSFYIGRLNSTSLLAAKAYDEDVNGVVLDLVYEFKANNSAEGHERVYSRMNVKVGETTMKFRDVKCSFE